MLSKFFLGLSLVGAEWVLFFLIGLSVLSVTLIIERIRFYRASTRGLFEYRTQVRSAISQGNWAEVRKISQASLAPGVSDLERPLVAAVLEEFERAGGQASQGLEQIAQDTVLRARLQWDKHLSLLATIGSNAPFVGLFGTVLGIIQAFHDLSQQAGGAAQTVTAGISEALVATAVGILVAIPATVAFNLFQRQVKSSLSEAEGLKNFLVGRMLASEQAQQVVRSGRSH